MLVVKLELWPGGDKKRAKDLGIVRIAVSDDTQRPEMGSYYVRGELKDETGTATVSAEVLEFPRKLGAWELVRRALDAISRKRERRVH